jgi:hypothetical protein
MWIYRLFDFYVGFFVRVKFLQEVHKTRGLKYLWKQLNIFV